MITVLNYYFHLLQPIKLTIMVPCIFFFSQKVRMAPDEICRQHQKLASGDYIEYVLGHF